MRAKDNQEGTAEALYQRQLGGAHHLSRRGERRFAPAALGRSTREQDRARLALKLHQTESALDSLTHLIEAAPFPMWYRGPDLKLGLVNSAFVHAVEGTDANEVIDRGFELVTVRQLFGGQMPASGAWHRAP